MTSDDFWRLIANYVCLDEGGLLDVSALEEALAGHSSEEIVVFDRIFTTLYCESYSWALWGAAYIINGGCSDDGFDYFRGWLIAMGRSVYEQAVRDPDSLVDVAEENVECEGMLYVARRAYEKSTGRDDFEALPYCYPDLGEDWDFDDSNEMNRRYPRLAAKFCG